MRSLAFLFAALLLAGNAVIAQPSQYFKFKNTRTNVMVCESESPGKDWVKLDGPFQDANCTVRD